MIDTPARPVPAQTGPWPVRLRAALAGLLAAAVALGVGELVAALVGPTSSPVIAVGSAFIDATPRPVKDFAIETFGERDKLALIVGTLGFVVVFALVVGVLARRDRRIGVAGIALFGALGGLAAVTRPTGSLVDALPSVIGAAAGIVALLAMLAPLDAAPATGGTAPTTPEAADPADRLRATLMRRNRKTGSLDRRGFFVASGIAAGVAAVTGGAGTLAQRRFSVAAARDALTLPAAAEPAAAIPAAADLSTQVPGLTPLFTPNADFYRVDINLTVPQVSPTDWSLRVHGRVRNELSFTLDDLINRSDVIERDITLTCVSNTVGGDLAGGARWLGVPLAAILAEAGVEDGADQVLTTAVDGFTIGTPTRDCLATEGAMLAFGMNGQPLPAEHGFPVRMIVPGLYGYVSATKWLVDMELTTFTAAVPYWVQRDWDAEAPIKIASRIDVPRPTGTAAGDLTIAGVAWAQTRGIATVEVRIDDADWVEAELAPETTVDMWRQWRLPWRAETGQHTLTVRATGQDGEQQPQDRADPFPNGAAGWHTLQVFVG